MGYHFLPLIVLISRLPDNASVHGRKIMAITHGQARWALHCENLQGMS